jgi:hypothetical protein
LTRELGESIVANGEESVGTPRTAVVVGSGEEVAVDVGGGINTVGEGEGSDDELREVVLLRADEVVLAVVVVGFAGVGTGKGRMLVLVVLGSFATRLLATFFAPSRSVFGIAFLSDSHPLLIGFRKRLSTLRSSSLQW